MVFTHIGKSTTAYNTLSKDMEEMQVSDLEYLEEPDIMDWSYLNIVIRKKLIIILKYYKRNKYIVQDYKHMEHDIRKILQLHNPVSLTRVE
jgi:hypothetical protein